MDDMKLTDERLNSLCATEVMGWESKIDADGIQWWVYENGYRNAFDPCKYWNDAFIAVGSVNPYKFDDIFRRWYEGERHIAPMHHFGDLTPRLLTEFALKAAGVEL